MADHNLIPPVSGNRSVPHSRSVPAKREQDKKQPRSQTPEKPHGKKDDDPPGIDEYA